MRSPLFRTELQRTVGQRLSVEGNIDVRVDPANLYGCIEREKTCPYYPVPGLSTRPNIPPPQIPSSHPTPLLLQPLKRPLQPSLARSPLRHGDSSQLVRVYTNPANIYIQLIYAQIDHSAIH
eukprot:GHVU01070065.1.p1 GENE.GHVU01070065.1~~GHVU01070065.1.p1  ORF type:complete len:122 (+),score=3.83 GHVU01070065.1:955-1320(+)